MNKRDEKKPTGRPPLDDRFKTIRVGFAIPEDLFKTVVKYCEKREVGYSAIFREAVEKFMEGKK